MPGSGYGKANLGRPDCHTTGAVENLLLDKRIRPLGLTDESKQDLVNFLKTLTGSNVEQLVSDAFAAPVGDVVSSQQEKQKKLTGSASR